ncbi:hypothetical protein [Nostoc sp. ChiVER01]|uniref:hypothetical protein n=1 Tax=Nostoc sp. ChiVER01 TaxID=3075382 RepID=UPI002AD31188|nr:hypothetical protein [Nostoc sp. ChiVER01]MDZ8227640.1 hypothetical protein [Nostoc sp. ChiVER01]
MNYKIVLASLLILSFSHLPAAASCPKGNPKSTDYIRRKPPNRCEGIIQQPLSNNDLNLISFATRDLTSFGKILTLQIPQIKGGQKPEIKVRSLGDDYDYQLDDLSLSNNGSRFSFSWDTYVLRQAKIPAIKLRAKAVYTIDSQPVVVPVILGQTSGKYEFVFYSEDRVKFTNFEILVFPHGQKHIYSTSSPNPRSGETIFTWDGRNAPTGRYELHYVAFVESTNETSARREGRIVFEHNPKWLK